MKKERAKKTRLTFVACAGAILCLCANAGIAGEVTGNGKSLKNEDGSLNGASECAFSGLNDTFSGDPDVADADGFFRTQNWGSLSKAAKIFLTSIGMHPGQACRPERD